MEKEKDKRAEEQAASQYESVADMVNRLEHAGECEGGEDCKTTDAEIYAGLNLSYKEGDKATNEEREEYHNEDNARQAIEEDPLSVQVRNSAWHSPGEGSEDNKPDEYEILLCTGGPACRIVGDLDEYGQPDTARIEFQDWFIAWEEWRGADEAILLEYARVFYFGE